MSLPFTDQDWIVLKISNGKYKSWVLRGPIPTQELGDRMTRVFAQMDIDKNKSCFLIYEDEKLVVVTESLTAEQIEALQGDVS